MVEKKTIELVDKDTLSADIGDKRQLQTNDKSNLVDAINEVKSEVDNVDLSSCAKVVDVGDKNNLQTTNKSNLVDAINELKSKADEAFQSGNNAKQGLVDALVAKDIEASTSESWDSLNSKVNNIKTLPGIFNNMEYKSVSLMTREYDSRYPSRIKSSILHNDTVIFSHGVETGSIRAISLTTGEEKSVVDSTSKEIALTRCDENDMYAGTTGSGKLIYIDGRTTTSTVKLSSINMSVHMIGYPGNLYLITSLYKINVYDPITNTMTEKIDMETITGVSYNIDKMSIVRNLDNHDKFLVSVSEGAVFPIYSLLNVDMRTATITKMDLTQLSEGKALLNGFIKNNKINRYTGENIITYNINDNIITYDTSKRYKVYTINRSDMNLDLSRVSVDYMGNVLVSTFISTSANLVAVFK